MTVETNLVSASYRAQFQTGVIRTGLDKKYHGIFILTYRRVRLAIAVKTNNCQSEGNKEQDAKILSALSTRGLGIHTLKGLQVQRRQSSDRRSNCSNFLLTGSEGLGRQAEWWLQLRSRTVFS